MVAVTVPAVGRVLALYAAARDLIRDELPASRVLRLPSVTAAGLGAAAAAVQVQHELTVAVGLIVQRARDFPPSSRRRRTLAGLAKWLAGIPGHHLAEERWFSVTVVRDVVAASGGTTTPPEVATLIALSILSPDFGPSCSELASTAQSGPN